METPDRHRVTWLVFLLLTPGNTTTKIAVTVTANRHGAGNPRSQRGGWPWTERCCWGIAGSASVGNHRAGLRWSWAPAPRNPHPHTGWQPAIAPGLITPFPGGTNSRNYSSPSPFISTRSCRAPPGPQPGAGSLPQPFVARLAAAGTERRLALPQPPGWGTGRLRGTTWGSCAFQPAG